MLTPNSPKFPNNRFRRLSKSCRSAAGLRLSFFHACARRRRPGSIACLASGKTLDQAFDSHQTFPEVADIPVNFTQAAVENAPERDTSAHDGHDDCDCVQVHRGRVARGDPRRWRANPCEPSRFAARCWATDATRRRFPARGRSCSRFPAGRVPRGRFLRGRRVVRQESP